MSRKQINNQRKEQEELEKLFEELSAEHTNVESQSDVDHSDSKDITVTKSETEQAFNSVKKELGFDEDDKQNSGRILPGVNQNFRYYLAAAIVLLAVALSILFIPVTNTVPLGETATIQLPDGSRVDMNSGTEIKYSRLFGLTNRHIQFNGEAYFEVTHSSNPFIVDANGAIVEVTGTEFNVRSWRGDPEPATIVTVASGAVQFYPVDRKPNGVELTNGFTSRWYHDDLIPSEPNKIDLEDAIAWKENNLSFVGQPLRLIFNELERKFDTTIQIQDERIGSEALTTFYSGPDSVEIILDDITTVKGLNYRETANGYLVFKETEPVDK